MLARTLALLTRSLRVESRMARASLGGLLLLVFTLWMLAMAHVQSSIIGAPGKSFFVSMTFLNFFLITLMGISHFTTAITEEKEEMTLGLLKMAGISPVALLLGKSTSRQILAVLALSVQFPFMLLAITLGGVRLHQLVAAYVSLLAYMLLLSNLALFFSVVCKRSGRASAAMVLFLLCFFVGPWIGYGVLEELNTWGYLARGGAIDSPLRAVLDGLVAASIFKELLTTTAFGLVDSVFGFQFFSNVAAAAVFFGLSWATFGYFTREEKPADPDPALFTIRRFAIRKRRNSRRAWTWALVWKDFYFVAGGVFAFLAKFVLYGLVVGVFLYSEYYFSSYNRAFRFDWKDVGEYAAGVALCGFIIESSLLAGRVLRDEIRWKTLSMIALLPRSLAHSAYAKTAGCLVGLVPAASWFCIGFLLNPEYVYGDYFGEINHPGFWYVIGLGVLFLHVVAYLSLHLKWGALPLGFVLVWITAGLFTMTTFMIVGFAMSYQNTAVFGNQIALETIVFATLAAVAWALAILVHLMIGWRLRTLAAQ